MFRIPTAFRAAAIAAVGTATALTLTGCINLGGLVPVATPTEPPKPTPTGFPDGGDTPEPIETTEPVEPTDPPVTGYTTLTDDYEVLSIQVPASWDDVDGAPFTTESGQEWASIVAAPDIEDYLNTWSTPGVEFAGTPISGRVDDATLTGFLEGVASYLADGCTAGDTAAPYDDGIYTGFASTFNECGGGDVFGYAIVAQNAEGTHAVYVRGQLDGQDSPEEILDVIISTFQASI